MRLNVVLLLGWVCVSATASARDSRARIVMPTGVVTDREFDDIVAVGDAQGFQCTGVALAPHFVITAAHCGTPTRVVVCNDITAPAQTVSVKKVHRPEEARIDAIILELSEPLAVKPHARRDAKTSLPPKGALSLLGFGASDPAGRAGFGTKRKTEVRAGSWGCDAERARSLQCAPGWELVIGRYDGRDTCAGDSGGPVFELAVVDGQNDYRLVAITSRAFPWARRRCGDGGIYTRIDAIAGWIDHVTRQQSKGGEP